MGRLLSIIVLVGFAFGLACAQNVDGVWEGEIQDPDKQLRPGMEGVGKVSIVRCRLLWIWMRPLVEWAQITAWKWAP